MPLTFFQFGYDLSINSCRTISITARIYRVLLFSNKIHSEIVWNNSYANFFSRLCERLPGRILKQNLGS